LRLPSGQNLQKISLKECVFINSALKIQYDIVKNTFPQTALAIFPLDEEPQKAYYVFDSKPDVNIIIILTF